MRWLVLVSGLAFVACQAGGGDGTPLLTPESPTVVGASTLTRQAEVATGADNAPSFAPEDRAFVGEVVRLQQGGDWAALNALVGFTRQPCTFGEQIMTLQPPCHEGQREGDLVDAFLSTACGGGAGRPGEYEAFIVGGARSRITSAARFYGVIARAHYALDAEYDIVFEGSVSSPDLGFSFSVVGRRIVAVYGSCGGLSSLLGPLPVQLVMPGDP